MHLKRYSMIFNNKSKNFFQKDVEFYDEAFNVWKEELEKELPIFWQDVFEKK